MLTERWKPYYILLYFILSTIRDALRTLSSVNTISENQLRKTGGGVGGGRTPISNIFSIFLH